MWDFLFVMIQTKAVIAVFAFIFITSVIEYFFPPLPGDTFLIFGAYLAAIGDINVFLLFASATLGGLIGSLGIYSLGATKGRKYFLKKNFTFFSASRVRALEGFFRRRGGIVIVLNRFTPGFRPFFFVAAGIAKMPFFRVASYSLASIMAWNSGLIYFGYQIGHRVGRIRDTRGYQKLVALLEEPINAYSKAALIALAIAATVVVAYAVIKKAFNRNNKSRGRKESWNSKNK